jgi:hypothetical protein
LAQRPKWHAAARSRDAAAESWTFGSFPAAFAAGDIPGSTTSTRLQGWHNRKRGISSPLTDDGLKLYLSGNAETGGCPTSDPMLKPSARLRIIGTNEVDGLRFKIARECVKSGTNPKSE